MKRRLFTLALLLCAVMGNATAIFNGQGQGTQSSPYEIWNLDRLNEVRNFVGDESTGVYFRLEKDLDLTEYLEGLSWEAIGSDTEPFKGVFLGNNKKITGMTINETTNNQGFFGCIDGATIQDLTVEGTVSGGAYVGGIVGSSSGTNNIKNCTFNGNVTGTGQFVGGIAGMFTGTLNNVKHTGTTNGTGYVGGIVGYHDGGSMTTATNTGNVTATSSNYAGGIAGLSKAAISSSNNTGTVTGKQYVGGLAGSAEGNKNVSNSSSNGKVTGTGYTGGLIGYKVGGTVSSCSANGIVSGGHITGGLIGQNTASVSNGTHSGGFVSGGSYTGGLIGKSTGSVSNGRHSGGNVSGGSNDYVGGLIGHLSSGSVTNSYTYANVTGRDNVGGIVGCYELKDGNSPQIASSGYFGNISARQYVGGILGSINYTGTVDSVEVSSPTLHSYKVYGAGVYSDKTYQDTMTEKNNIVSIKDCVAVGDVIASSKYVGGILGKGIGGEALTRNSSIFYCSRYDSNHKFMSNYTNEFGDTYATYGYELDGTFMRQYSKYFDSHAAEAWIYYYTYTHTKTNTSLTDNYFSGNLKGTDYVGGVVGHMHGGTISRNYSYAAIEGSNKVGGIVGYMQADLSNITTTLSSNVTLNSTVTASADAGKVYGYTTGNYLTIATSGNSINKTLNTTNLIVNGITQTTSNSAQHGTLQTQRQLTQSTAYSGLGWNFDMGAEWTSEESKSYPYHQWQTAPPTIETGAYKGSTTLTGKCTDNGTVYVTINGGSTVYQATCSDGNWSRTIPALRSGDLIRAWSKSATKEQSYQTSTTATAPGSGTEADPWLIYDAYDLKAMAQAGYYKMMNDVSLTSWISANSSSTGWTGVGSNGTGAIVFDGNNKKVTGLWCNTTTENNGLFSYFENITIKDLTVEVASGKQMKGGNYTAILAGQLKNSTVTNVTVEGTVNGADYTAIMAGGVENSTVTNVTMEGTVNGADLTAALTGYSVSNTISECNVVDCVVNNSSAGMFVGGMLAYSSQDNISNCTVKATIKTTNTGDSGWVVRGGVGGSLNNSTITDCSFNGAITTSEKSYVGGIIGRGDSGFNITKCQANVTITVTGANSYAGGLAGSFSSTGSSSLNFTEGTVVASGTNSYAGGLIGYTTANNPVENCMSTANVTGTGYVGGIVGYAKGSVKKCVATGSLLANSDDGYAGGIVGFIEGSEAIIKGCGGLNKRIETGSNQWGFRIIGGTGSDITRPEISDNYGWDEMPILRNNSLKTVYDDPYEGTAKTTAELQQQSTYEAMEWDFTDIWTMSNETHQPILQWLATPAFMLGDLNDDGSVSITDVVLIIDVIAGTITDPNKVAAADVNGDGDVSITDCVAAIDLIAAQQPSGARAATNNGQRSMFNGQSSIYTTSDFISASMEGNMLNVALDNTNSYTAFQMTVSVPEGMTLGKATMDQRRGADHQVMVRNLGNGQYLVAGFSMDKDILAGNSGRLLTIATNGHAAGDIIINNVEFATTEAEGYRLESVVISGTTTGISDITRLNDKGQTDEVYDLQGRRVNGQASKGLHIINGKKVNTK